MKTFGVLLIACAVGLLPDLSHAGGCGCIPVSLPVGEQFLAHRPGALRLGYSLIYSDTNHYYIGTERQDGAGQTEEAVAPSTLGFDNVIRLEYDLEHGIALGLEIPIVHSAQSRGLGGVKGTMSATGLGDTRVLANYWFRNDPNGLAMHVGGGIRIPTGKSDKTFRAQNGSTVTQDLAAQAGTGNFAGLAELGGSMFFGQRFGLAFSTRYTFTPAATTVNNFRNELNGSGWEKNSDSDAVTARVSLATPLGTGDNAWSRVSGRVSFDLAWIPFDDLFGESDGFRRAGVITAIGPGLSYTPIPSVTLSADVPLTVYRNVQRNGGNVQEWTLMFGVTLDRVSL